MALSRAFPLFIAGVVSITVTLFAHQQAPVDPRSQATFKTGIDIVQLDVSVFDQDRRPLRGLTMEDFTVLENGSPQPIVAVVPIEVPEASTPSATWLRDAPLDAVSNSGDTRRLITIVLDDASMGYELGEPKSAREVAHKIVDQMGPEDLASVVFTYLGKPQNWTTDRSRLRSAIESVRPRATSAPPPPMGRGIAPTGAPPSGSVIANAGLSGGPLACSLRRGRSCVVDTLWSIGTVLEDAPPGRKIVMLISSNGGLNVMENPDRISEFQGMFKALQRVNATVYAFDPRGLTTAATGVETDDLRSIAGATGGYVFANTNAPEARVPDVFRWNGSYYLIGFRSTDAARDGRFRRIQVKVNRPGVQTRTRVGYYAPRNEPPSPARKATTEDALDTALSGLIPAAGLPITISVGAFAIPGQRDPVVTVVAGMQHAVASPGASQRVKLVTSVFDHEGRSHGTHRQTLDLTSTGDTLRYDVYSRIPSLKPGSYELRFAAETGGQAGSVFAGIDVPDFAKADLELSGVLLERWPPPSLANEGELSSVTSVKPTAARTFSSSERVRAFVRVYQKEPRPVRVTSRVTNDRNEPVASHADDFAAEAFARQGSVDSQVELPLASLAAGQYLLTIEALAGDTRVTREVRFTVR
jgi:VWFA-related protein